MERWSKLKSDYVENEKIDNFLRDIIEVYKKHGLSISHEDAHGAFEIEELNDFNMEWILHAIDNTKEK